MPALNRAKRMAHAASCLSNDKTLMMAWTMYAGDNDDRICGANNGVDTLGLYAVWCDEGTCGADGVDC